METRYDQFCPIAKASEVFATRWTPLILRELMADIHGFNDIHRGVPLISRAVLAARLRELEDHGIIERRARPDGPGHEYWLTNAGDAFRSVVSALGQWGLVHARDRIKPSDLDPSLLMWGFRKRADRDALPDRRVVVRFEFSDVPAMRTRFRIMWLVLRCLILALVFVPALTLLVAARPRDTGANAVSRDCASQVAGVRGC